jgi:hypothetical protein
MSGTQEFLFGIIFCGAITALIVMVAVVRGRLENHESKTEVKGVESGNDSTRELKDSSGGLERQGGSFSSASLSNTLQVAFPRPPS